MKRNNVKARKQEARHSKRRRPKRELTNLANNVVSKLRNADSLLNCLSAGSKNRFRQYQRNLATSRGNTDEEVEFDKFLYQMIQKYVYDIHDFHNQVQYLYKLRDDEGYRFSRNLKLYSHTSDAYERFSEPDFTSFRWNENYRESLKEMKEEFSNLHLTPLSYYSDDDIRNSLPKLDTHSGYFWITSGKKYKGENMEGILNIFLEEVNVALQDKTFSKPILCGNRTQASGEYDDEGNQTNSCKHKTRVVSMVDLILIILELKFSKPIQEYLGQQSYYAGGKDEDEISRIISDYRVRFQKFMSIDYSSFDQTISSWLIEDVFDVIKSAFILQEEDEALFDIMVHDFIHKDFVLYEGVLHSDKGVPSGSMFTQIIDSLVNVLVIRTFFKSIHGTAKMICMGDDNVIFTSADTSIVELSTYVAKNFGLIVKVDDKSNEGVCSKDNVKFLSRFWTWYGRYRHPHQLLSRMLYPERKRNYNKEIGPQHVIFAFILTYGQGMTELMDVNSFTRDYPISKDFVMSKVDSRYLPGALAYIREYT